MTATSEAPSGVRWIGIGAQRCGTTWFTDLLCQHPQVDLSSVEAGGPMQQKELHILDRFGMPTADLVAEYRRRFPESGHVHRGEFTPSYLRSPWVPDLVERVASPDCPLFLLLRDPIDRFRSAIDLKVAQRGVAVHELSRELVYDAIWAGLYTVHLDAWYRFADRIMVISYERLRLAPASVMAEAWAHMGLEPVELEAVDRPSLTAVDHEFSIDAVDGLGRELERAYRREFELLEGLDQHAFWVTYERLRSR